MSEPSDEAYQRAAFKKQRVKLGGLVFGRRTMAFTEPWVYVSTKEAQAAQAQIDAEWTVSDDIATWAVDESYRRGARGLTIKDARHIIETAVTDMLREREAKS